MAFAFRAAPRSQTAAKGTVFAVGRRVYVVSTAAVPSVTLTDDAGTKTGTVKRGTQVEILAWRPLGSNGTRYRVRSPGNGVEGWLGVANVCATKSPPAATAAVRKPS